MRSPLSRCRRCGGSVLGQQFTDDSGRGTRWTCLSCADEREQLEDKTRPTPAELRRIF